MAGAAPRPWPGRHRRLDQEIAGRIIRENALSRSESSYRFLTNHTPDLIIRLDARGQLLYCTPNFSEFTGYTVSEFEQFTKPWELIHQEYLESMRCSYKEMIKSGVPTLFTFELVRKDTSRHWVDGLGNPTKDPDTGLFNGVVAVIRNIDERVRVEGKQATATDQRETLLKELHHRVKNNFGLLDNILRLYQFAPPGTDLLPVVSDLRARIHSMSLVHTLLYKNDDLEFIDFDIYLMHLCSTIAKAFRTKPVEIIDHLQPCRLSFKSALPLGMVINELITNSFKYAFTEDSEGILYIDLTVHETDAAGQPLTWKLSLRDNGKGLPEEYARKNEETLGSQIAGMLTEQASGTLDAFNHDGACFIIIFKQNPN